MDPLEFRTRAFFDGVIRAITQKSVPFDLVDVLQRSSQSLTLYPRLVLTANEIMDAASQEKLVEYVRRGGTLIVFPMLPKFDRKFASCRIMEEKFGIHVKGRASSNRVYMGRLRDIPVPQPPWVLAGSDLRVLATDAHGDVVGIEKRFGKGRIRMFGFFVYYTIEEHPELLAQMMECAKVSRNAWTDNNALHVECPRSGREGILFVGNFHRATRSSEVWVQNPRGADTIALGKIELPAVTGLLLPIQTDVGRNVTLRFAYGELLDASPNTGRTAIVLRGPAGTKGRVCVKIPRAFHSISVQGKPVPVRQHGDFVFADYDQTGDPQVVEFH